MPNCSIPIFFFFVFLAFLERSPLSQVAPGGDWPNASVVPDANSHLGTDWLLCCKLN